MRNTFSLIAATALAALFTAGCAGPERKLGRGFNNTFELVRGGELRTTMEQTAIFRSPDEAYTTGFFRGLNRSLARAGIGIYEIVTFPLPSYDPICTSYLKPNAVYPDNYKPCLVDDSKFATDTYVGFSGGDIAPWSPGSRFHVIDN